MEKLMSVKDIQFPLNAIYFWEHPLYRLKEIYQSLSPGRRLNLAFVEKKFGGYLPWTWLEFNFYDVDEVKGFFKASGFVDIEVTQMVGESSPFISVTGRK